MVWYLVKHRNKHFTYNFTASLYDEPLLTKWLKFDCIALYWADKTKILYLPSIPNIILIR